MCKRKIWEDWCEHEDKWNESCRVEIQNLKPVIVNPPASVQLWWMTPMEIICFYFYAVQGENGWKISGPAYFSGYHLIFFSSWILVFIEHIFLI